MRPDQERVHALLVDTVTLLCKNGLNFQNGLRIEGVIGITVDENEVFIVHINKILQNDTVEKCRDDKDSTATETFTVAGESEEASPHKRKRNRSEASQDDKSSHEPIKELPGEENGYSDITSEGLNSVQFEEMALKSETNDEVMFVKTESSDALGCYNDFMAVSSYTDETMESTVRHSSHMPVCRTNTTGYFRSHRPTGPFRRTKTSASQFPYMVNKRITDQPADASFNYDTQDVANSSEECNVGCDPLPYSDQTNAIYTPSHMEADVVVSKHLHIQRSQSTVIKRRPVTGLTLPRKSEGNLWQVVSRFICNFPGCTLSFSTKQNLLRHQTQKHGRQKSRIVGPTRRFLQPTDSISDIVTNNCL